MKKRYRQVEAYSFIPLPSPSTLNTPTELHQTANSPPLATYSHPRHQHKIPPHLPQSTTSSHLKHPYKTSHLHTKSPPTENLILDIRMCPPKRQVSPKSIFYKSVSYTYPSRYLSNAKIDKRITLPSISHENDDTYYLFPKSPSPPIYHPASSSPSSPSPRALITTTTQHPHHHPSPPLPPLSHSTPLNSRNPTSSQPQIHQTFQKSQPQTHIAYAPPRFQYPIPPPNIIVSYTPPARQYISNQPLTAVVSDI